MILVKVRLSPADKGGHVSSLLVKNHGAPIVCAGISALVLNTINSIETLTSDVFSLKHEQEGGFIEISFPNKLSPEAQLLMASLMLGIKAALAEYPKEIKIKYE